MKRTLRHALAVVLLCATSLCLARPGPGDLPPDYLGHDANGHEVHVSALHGKVVIVTFWASWCGYCRKELPVLAALQKLKGTADLQVVGVDHDDDLDTFRQLRRRWKDLDVMLTYDAGDGRIAKPYGVNGIPHMVMIGRDGRIADVYVGYGEDMLDSILARVDELLAEPVPAAPVAAVPAAAP
ncbi:TlpA family protein disulfide reductase [Dyella soli]|uniref:TlpA family protein disulfide reductase n=1 Tax=Dyella soli TaxID=522319 RepID=A0A4R0YL22_9GAMM|nr:TlpA disulfide reductase family protein [Dyella soli]TCI09517.1 TlpA family protein disulfide reductase [Dyella soli]